VTKRYFSNGLLTLMTITLLFSILLLAIPVMTNPGPGPEDWPMYSHDVNLTGYTTSPAPDTNGTLWIFTTGGTLLDQPAIKGGKLYIMSADGFFYCLNSSTGTVIWKTNMSDVLKAPGPRVDTHSAANAVVDGKVYGGTFHYYNASVGGVDMGPFGRVFCLNADTGALIWNFTGSITGTSPYGSEFGWSPMIFDDKLYISEYAGLVYCLNATTGAEIWRSANTGGVNYGMTAVADVAVGDRRIYLGGTHTDVICLNDTGGVEWRYNTGGTVWNVLVADGKVYAGSQDGKVYCLDATTSTLIWTYTRPIAAYARSALSVHGDRLFFASQDKNVTCVNKNTGAFIWNYTTNGTFGYQSGPYISGDGKVLVGSGDTYIYCLNEVTGALIWKYKTGGLVWGVAIANGIAYATSWDNNVYAIPEFPAWVPTLLMLLALGFGVSFLRKRVRSLVKYS